MISGYTTQRDWNNIGYEVIKGNFLPGQKITLRRPPENSPNRVPEMWDESILDFDVFKSRQEELKALAESIPYNLKQDYLNPSRDILVIVLGSYKTNFRQLQINVAEYLIEQGINIYIPIAPEYNILKFNKMQAKRNVFWRDGAITVSGIYHAKGNEAVVQWVG
jgi:superfamily I DNA and RNA helicase